MVFKYFTTTPHVIPPFENCLSFKLLTATPLLRKNRRLFLLSVDLLQSKKSCLLTFYAQFSRTSLAPKVSPRLLAPSCYGARSKSHSKFKKFYAGPLFLDSRSRACLTRWVRLHAHCPIFHTTGYKTRTLFQFRCDCISVKNS